MVAPPNEARLLAKNHIATPAINVKLQRLQCGDARTYFPGNIADVRHTLAINHQDDHGFVARARVPHQDMPQQPRMAGLIINTDFKARHQFPHHGESSIVGRMLYKTVVYRHNLVAAPFVTPQRDLASLHTNRELRLVTVVERRRHGDNRVDRHII